MSSKGTSRICPDGHTYYKSSDCPACPVCEAQKKPHSGFMSLLSAPARRALEGKGISTLKHLARHSAEEILALHGIGKTALPKLEQALKAQGLSFRSK